MGSAGDDAPPGAIDAPVDQRMIDAPCVVQVGPTCGGKLWSTDFSVDPTTIDNNCDGVADFHVRETLALPGTLANGVWAEPGSFMAPALHLDTAPADPFLTRTIVHARMRSVAVGMGSRHGALLWIDVGDNGTQFGSVFVEMRQTGDAASQNISLWEKAEGGVEIFLDPLPPGFDTGFHDVDLDIDPTAETVTFSVDGVNRGNFGFEEKLFSPSTHAASLTADGSSAEFDAFSVERCP
jgi:hypothetical protein